VHLRNNNALGAIHDEGTIRCHQRHIAHIDILFLNIANRPRTGILIFFPNNKAKRDAQRRRIGQTALLTFFDIIFWGLKIIGHEFKN